MNLVDFLEFALKHVEMVIATYNSGYRQRHMIFSKESEVEPYYICEYLVTGIHSHNNHSMIINLEYADPEDLPF